MFHASTSKVVTTRKKHFVILGGGITGLATAWFLRQRYGSAIHLTVIEKTARLGGWIETARKEGFLFEQGPRGCRPIGNGVDTLQLIQSLKLEDHVIFNSPAAQKRYLYRHEKLIPLPSNLWEICRTPWLLRMLWKPLWKEWSIPKGKQEDESVSEFAIRRLGVEIADTLIDPLVSGIYAGNSLNLSIKSCFPLLYQWEQEHGSLLRGAFVNKKKAESDPFIRKIQQYSLFSLQDGMETLIQELARQTDLDILLNTTVSEIDINSSQITMTLPTKTLHADHLFSAIPAQAFGALIEPHDSRLAKLLKKNHNTSLITVSIGYKKSLLKESGFGYLIPSKEREPILGMIWDSSVFPQQNNNKNETRLTVMLGGEHQPEALKLKDEEIHVIVAGVLEKHLGIREKPDAFVIKRAINAIPQYSVGHSQHIQTIIDQTRKLSNRITLLGISYNGVGVNDCIARARLVK